MPLPTRSRRTLPAFPLDAAEELKLLEHELGGRRGLVQALTFAPPTKDTQYLLGLIADPDHRARSLAECLQMGRIAPGQLIDTLAKGTSARARLIAQKHVADRTPTVVAEVMQQAAEHEDDCPECLGAGTVTADPTEDHPNPQPLPCDVCRGYGKLRFPADPTCRELALDMAGMIGKAGGITVQQTTNVGIVGGGLASGYERMQEAVDQILYGDAREPIDAELVDTAAPPADNPPAESNGQ
jgi:hypothetical protein